MWRCFTSAFGVRTGWRLLAKEFDAISALDKRLSLRNQALKVTERTSEPFCAFWLPPLRLFAVAELALDPVDRALKQFDQMLSACRVRGKETPSSPIS